MFDSPCGEEFFPSGVLVECVILCHTALWRACLCPLCNLLVSTGGLPLDPRKAISSLCSAIPAASASPYWASAPAPGNPLLNSLQSVNMSCVGKLETGCSIPDTGLKCLVQGCNRILQSTYTLFKGQCCWHKGVENWGFCAKQLSVLWSLYIRAQPS